MGSQQEWKYMKHAPAVLGRTLSHLIAALEHPHTKASGHILTLFVLEACWALVLLLDGGASLCQELKERKVPSLGSHGCRILACPRPEQKAQKYMPNLSATRKSERLPGHAAEGHTLLRPAERRSRDAHERRFGAAQWRHPRPRRPGRFRQSAASIEHGLNTKVAEPVKRVALRLGLRIRLDELLQAASVVAVCRDVEGRCPVLRTALQRKQVPRSSEKARYSRHTVACTPLMRH